MYHIEGLIRANHFNLQELEMNVISKYSLSPDQMQELRSWYQNLIKQMLHDGIEESGHLQSLKELIFKLNDLHIQLLNTIGEERYVELYQWAKDIIAELKQKMLSPEITEMEVCINGLYGFMLLKLKNNDISQETAQAMAVMSQLLGYVSKKYHANLAVFVHNVRINKY
jgi:flagellin-specific chaperone FliS